MPSHAAKGETDDRSSFRHYKEEPTVVDYFLHIDASINSIPQPILIPPVDQEDTLFTSPRSLVALPAAYVL
jgi:hypothetical protein